MRPATNENHDEKRATAGVARFSRTWLPRIVVVAVVGAFVWAALRGSDGSGGPSGEPSDTTSSEDDEAAGTEPSPDDPADDAGDTQPPDVPADVEEERPDVDLAQPPDGADPVDVARWWGGTFVGHSGAEPPAALAERLAGVVTPELQAEMAAEPPAASYDEPTEIVGASAAASTTASTVAGSTAMRVTVETVGALLVYDVTLTQDAAGTWRVAEATPV